MLIIAAVLAPVPARAQGYFAPFIGYDFGGDAGSCSSIFTDCAEKRTSYGIAAGFLSGGILGFEEDFSYAPDFFGSSASFGSNSVLTLMSNLVVGIPAGPVRPYASGGVGLIRTKVATVSQLLNLSDSGFGYDLGGGVMLFFGAHLGVRGDFRHIRSTKDFDLLGISLPNTKLNFSRISVGLVLH
jgi:opacity protein-like surface antigen